MKSFNYRHIICVLITLGCLTCGVFLFPNALDRIVESFRDFGLSVAYYFCEFIGIEHSISPTVTQMPQLNIIPNINGGAPSTSLPETWTEFQINWDIYWGKWASIDNFSAYLYLLANLLFKVCQFLVLAVLIIIIFVLLFRRYLNKKNNDFGIESKPLRIFKRVTAHTFMPVKKWIIEFISFIKEHRAYWIAWFCIWLYCFNVFTIIIEFFAYFLYFSMSFDISNLYLQVYKLALDLSAVIDFIPLWAWFIVAYFILNLISIKIAYQRLYHNERCNRGFLNERGISNTVDGPMGLGKTQFITDMALSAEVQLRDMALEVIIESDFHFPNFPWINLELFLKKMFRKHRIYDVWSCRRVIRSKYLKWRRNPCKYRIWGYDYERYGLIYNDNLKDISVWQAIEDYASAYLIYTRQCALLISNYSIRSDNLIDDLGNFPLWNTDFFKRDSKLIESYSRHSHIIDYDMLRLGTVMNKENPNRYAFGFGVYVISEIDKERSNSKKLNEKKANLSDCNQQNDLFDLNTMMSRHAVNIGHRCFLIMLSDLQRFEELGISTLGLGEKISIKSKSDMSPVLPFFSPFWLFDLVAEFIIDKFDNYYLKKRHDRGDYYLPMYLMKNFVAKLRAHRERVNNLFGCSVLTLSIEQGRNNDEALKRKYYMQSKKIWSERYSTDCLSGIYAARGKLNRIGIDDIVEYSGIMATDEELQKQHSHFQYEVHKVLI